MLLPALASAKQRAQAAGCMSNTHQMLLAWNMYADDNNDVLAPNDYPYLTAYRGAMGLTNQMHNWVVGTMASALDANGAPNSPSIAELSDRNTLLSRYLQNYKIYHCPADNYINHLTGNINLRSYSMNSAVGTCFWTHYNAPNYPLGSAVGEGWLSGSWVSGCGWAVVDLRQVIILHAPRPFQDLGVYRRESLLHQRWFHGCKRGGNPGQYVCG